MPKSNIQFSESNFRGKVKKIICIVSGRTIEEETGMSLSVTIKETSIPRGT